MDVNQPLPLLGGLTPAQFMRRHWQKKPLLVRQAISGFAPLLGRRQLFDLAASDATESRLIVQERARDRWRVRHGPVTRRALPPLARPDWTLLVQGVDLHDDRVHALLQQFRFAPQARLDDLMISYATPGGGVGPHFDSYDVFLLQARGRRRWRIGRQKDLSLRDDVPLKILSNFQAEVEYVLEPGDMLYLPPRWAHDGIAESECMTYSVGFKVPSAAELGRELLQRLSDDATDPLLYRDPAQPATAHPGEIPAALGDFAGQAVQKLLGTGAALQRSLGEYLTEPKASVWFDEGQAVARLDAIRLDRRTRMMYDAQHVFINGESWRAAGRDARLLHQLADERSLDAAQLRGSSAAARALMSDWCAAGWAHGD